MNLTTMKAVASVVTLCAMAIGCGGSDQRQTSPPQTPASTPAAEPSFTPAAATRRPGAAAQPIAMPSGATSLTVKGALEAGKDAEYLIGEKKGNVFTVHATTPERDLDVVVYRADTGARLEDETPRNPNFFMARLPETLGYLVVVRAIDNATPYTLDIEVPRRLVFDPQTKMIEVGYPLPAHGVLAYLTPPGAAVSAELIKAPPDAYLTAHGLAGKVFLKATDNKRAFSGAPAASSEGLVLRVEQGGTGGDFTLRVRRQ